MIPVDMTKWTEKNPGGLNPTKRTPDNWEELGAGEVAVLKEEHTNWPSSAKWSALKTYIQVALHGLNRLYLRIYIICNTHGITVKREVMN